MAYINGYYVNLRSGPSTNNSVLRKLQYGEAYKVWGKLGNWLNLGGNQWIYYDSLYIRYAGEASSVEGKRVVSKVDDLRFYSKPSWADRDVAGYVDEGLGFQIIDKVSVNSSQQYKAKNSRGNVFYITASSYLCRSKVMDLIL